MQFEIPYFRPPEMKYDRVGGYITWITESRIYTKGQHRDTLERLLEAYIGVNHVVTCASGTSAIFIGLRALKDLYEFKSIAIPSFTWDSDKLACEMAGYDIKYLDINLCTWLVTDVNKPCDLFMDLDTFGNRGEIWTEYDKPAVIDATHSLGHKGFGCRGLIEFYSMAATKPVTAGGEGGFLVTDDHNIADRAIELRDSCSRLTEIQCLFALKYLEDIEGNLRAKKTIAKYYRSHLPFKFQMIDHDSTYSKVGFLCGNSTELIQVMAEKGIECRKYYKPLVKGLKNSDYVYEHIVCLPAWIGVDYMQVTETLQEILANKLP